MHNDKRRYLNRRVASNRGIFIVTLVTIDFGITRISLQTFDLVRRIVPARRVSR